MAAGQPTRHKIIWIKKRKRVWKHVVDPLQTLNSILNDMIGVFSVQAFNVQSMCCGEI